MSGEERARTKRSSLIDSDIRASSVLDHESNLLLLGPGECGKSTLFRQFKILQDNGGFTEAELRRYISSVHSNVVSQMFILVQYGPSSFFVDRFSSVPLIILLFPSFLRLIPKLHHPNSH